jgi:hypothetical protein
MRAYWDVSPGWSIAMITTIVVIIVLIVYGINNIREWQREVKRVEISTGCEYVGGTTGTNRVGYFDCNGVIETKRIK